MSEEEDTEDNKILVKKLPWRSESMCTNAHDIHTDMDTHITHARACMHTHSKDSHSQMMHFYSTELNQLVEKLDAFALEAAKSKKNFVPDRIESSQLSPLVCLLHLMPLTGHSNLNGK